MVTPGHIFEELGWQIWLLAMQVKLPPVGGQECPFTLLVLRLSMRQPLTHLFVPSSLLL